MQYIIDRFEGDKAVLENEQGEILAVSKSLLPKNAHEGDCLIYEDSGIYTLDENSTAKRKEKMDKLVDDLFV